MLETEGSALENVPGPAAAPLPRPAGPQPAGEPDGSRALQGMRPGGHGLRTATELEDAEFPKDLRLLPRSALLKTGDVDEADWNYRPALGWVQRVRFRLITSLLPRARVPRLLELGYGSGVFHPELARRCTELFGIDVHSMNQDVADVLARAGVKAQLYVAGGEALPFDAHTMDVVVAVSSLEFMQDLDAACREVRRVLRPTGCFVVVTPGRSALVDAGVKLLTGKSARREFGSRRDEVLPALRRHFKVERQLHYPPFGGSWLRFYDALRLVPPSE